MATTVIYLDTKFHRIFDRSKNELERPSITISEEISKFGDSCIDMTNTEHKGIYFPDGVNCLTEAFTISAWIRLTSTIDNFVFIGNKDDVTDIDAWETGNDSALSSDVLDHTTATNFVVSADNQHIVNAAIIALDDLSWHHFVLTRIKGDPNDTLVQFVDGLKISETELETTKKIDFSQLVIGCSGNSNSLIGYMDDFCFIKGGNIWTTDFTSPQVAIREDENLSLYDYIARQTTRQWIGSTDVIDVATNQNIATWELLELGKPFALKLS